MSQTPDDLIEWTPPPVRLTAVYEVDRRYPCPSTLSVDIAANPDGTGVYQLVRAAIDALARVPASAAHELSARRAAHAEADLL